MGLKENLLKELKEAMQAKDTIRKDTITMLRAAILQIEKDTQKELSEDDMLAIVAKEVKKRKESLPEYEKAGRDDIVENLNKEIKILEVYLPEQLTEDEIRELVIVAIKEVGAESPKDMGKVMQNVRAKTQGKADGKVISDIVKAELNNL
jgi:uncharacterized protein YqeY